MLTDEPTMSDEITINDVPLTDHEIGLEMQHHPADTREAARKKAIEALLIKQVLFQEAKKQGCDGQEVIAQHPNPELGEGETESREEAAIRILLERNVSTPEATEEECLRFYEINRERFRTPPLIQARHILLPAAPDDLAARRQGAAVAKELITKLIKKPEQFKKLAKEFSACPSKSEGGDLGQLTRGQTVPEFERQLFVLPEGLSGRPIETRYGYHVVKVEKKEEGKQMEFEMVKGKIRNYLRDKVSRKGISQYIHRLLADADIQGIDLDLESSMLMQ